MGAGCDGEAACRRGSVGRALSGHRFGDHPSMRPTWGHVAGPAVPRFGLAPGGVCRAARVTPGAGALLPHRFTLTCATPSVQPSAVCSLWHFPAGRPDWPLASTLPCGAPTFLDTITEASCRGHPAASPCTVHDRAPLTIFPVLMRSVGRRGCWIS